VKLKFSNVTRKQNLGYAMSGQLRTIPLAIASVGMTVDGREITEQDIDDIAQTYNYKRVAARINLEHEGKWSGPFAKYIHNQDIAGFLGDVIEVTTEFNSDGVKCLYAVLSPNDGLLKLNKADQAVFFSIEIQRNFMNSEQTYLTGLAITDNPASTYTDRIKFSQNQTGESKGDTDVTFLKVELGDLKEPKQSIFKNLFNLKKDDEMKPEQVAAAIKEALGEPLAQFNQALTANTEATNKLLEQHSNQPGDENAGSNDSGNLSTENEVFTGKQKQAFDEVTSKVDGLSKGIDDLTKAFNKAVGENATDTTDSEEEPPGENGKYANLL
jgi:hypothetical protein